MARYFFDIHDGKRFTQDNEGVDLAGIEAAKAEAGRTLPDIARETMPHGDSREYRIEVRDETGRPVLRLGLSYFTEYLN